MENQVLLAVRFLALGAFLLANLHSLQGQTEKAAASDRLVIHSDGHMDGGTLQRTRVWRSAALERPQGVIWSSAKLFAIKEILDISGSIGPFYWYGSVHTGHSFTEPIVADDVVYFSVRGDDTALLALSAETGKTLWRFRLKNTALSAPAVALGSVFVGDGTGNIYALDQLTGKEKWRYKIKGRSFNLTFPAVADGVLYLNSAEPFDMSGKQTNYNSDESIYALDAATGQEKWVFKGKGILTAIAISGETLYFASKSGILYALERRTGREIWKYSVGKALNAPAILDGLVYVVDSQGQLFAVDAAIGALKWRSDKDTKIGTQLSFLDGTAFFGLRENSVIAIDATTAREKWRYTTSKPCSSPVTTGKVVYFPCADGVLYAVDAIKGAELWKFKSQEGYIAPPVLSKGRLYFVDSAGYAYAMK